MRLRLCWIVATIVLLSSSHSAAATILLEETGFIFGFGGENYSFVADETPLLYEVTLTDLEFPGEFDILGVAITTSTESVVELLAPGTTTFNAQLGTTYFANVLGLADEELGAGLFGIKIATVPEPGTVTLLVTAWATLALYSWRRRGA
jgi:hypothetical protein